MRIFTYHPNYIVQPSPKGSKQLMRILTFVNMTQHCSLLYHFERIPEHPRFASLLQNACFLPKRSA